MKKYLKKKLTELIISVESRKGGVGKTTAALCLARLLNKSGYAVIVLDLDITGTNAADIATSPFWEEYLNVIRKQGAGDWLKTKPENLIELFDNEFMTGRPVPGFVTQESTNEYMHIDLKKVNVLGSQIYKTGGYNDRNREKVRIEQNSKETCIERPGVLFDDLHAFWFLKFIKQLISNFKRIACENNYSKIAIIMDNSPGYVGIAPAIHDWLTDRGPELNKFLTVTSLDGQDLSACGMAIDALHHLYTEKWKTSRLFIEACDGNDQINISKDQEAFFMRLATPIKNNSEDEETFTFYTSRKADKNNSGQIFCSNPSQYIALIINRVPRAVKMGYLAYNFQNLLDLGQDDSAFTKLIYNKNNNRDKMISYDEYIENQYLVQYLQRNRKYNRPDIHRLIDSLENAEKELLVGIRKIENRQLKWFKMDYHNYSSLISKIKMADDILTRALSAVDIPELVNLAGLIRGEWLPGKIIPDFKKALMKYLRESRSSYFKIIPFEGDNQFNDQEIHEFFEDFKRQLLREMQHLHIDIRSIKDKETFDIFSGALSELVSLSWITQLRYSPQRKELFELFAAVIDIELIHWAKKEGRRSDIFSIQSFLAQESIVQDVSDEEMEMLEEYKYLRHHNIIEGIPSFADFYKVCTSLQARMIDIIPDSLFLIKLLRFMVKGAVEKDELFPFVKGIAEDVIVNKKVSHEEAPTKMAEALKAKEYFAEFDAVIKKVLDNWGVCR